MCNIKTLCESYGKYLNILLRYGVQGVNQVCAYNVMNSGVFACLSHKYGIISHFLVIDINMYIAYIT